MKNSVNQIVLIEYVHFGSGRSLRDLNDILEFVKHVFFKQRNV